MSLSNLWYRIQNTIYSLGLFYRYWEVNGIATKSLKDFLIFSISVLND